MKLFISTLAILLILAVVAQQASAQAAGGGACTSNADCFNQSVATDFSGAQVSSHATCVGGVCTGCQGSFGSNCQCRNASGPACGPGVPPGTACTLQWNWAAPGVPPTSNPSGQCNNNQFLANLGSLTVPGTEVFNIAAGIPITLSCTLLPTDRISLTVSGQVFLQPGNTYGTNAAGIVVTPGTLPTGSFLPGAPGGFTFGSLVFGNSAIPAVGVRQLFQPTVANGAGSLSPPTTLTLSTTLAALGFVNPIPAGTTLRFWVADTNTGDNSGQFSITNLSFLTQNSGCTTSPPAFVCVGNGDCLGQVLGATASNGGVIDGGYCNTTTHTCVCSPANIGTHCQCRKDARCGQNYGVWNFAHNTPAPGFTAGSFVGCDPGNGPLCA